MARVVEIRNRILSICSQLDQIRKDQSHHRALALAFLLALGVLAAIFAAAWPVSLLLGAVFGVAAAVLIGLMVYQYAQVARLERMAIEAHQRLTAERAAFDNAVAEVMAACDAECWGLVDLTQPLCSAETA